MFNKKPISHSPDFSRISLFIPTVGFVVTLGLAATPGTPVQAQGANNLLEEIVVTARRREENLQEIPITVTAVSGDTLEDFGARSLNDLTELVPGLIFKNSGGNFPLIAMRGSGNRLAARPGVGVFQDGVVLSRVQISRGPIDAARAEVAKGPQSTLYGQSTIGGAIGLITNQPTETFEGRIEAGVGGSSSGYGAAGDEGIWNVQGILSGPIIEDQLLGRMVVSRQKRDGYAFDPVSGYRGLGYDRTFFRGKLLWLLSDAVDLQVTAEYLEDNLPRMETFGFDSTRRPVFTVPFFRQPVDFGEGLLDTRANFQPFNDSTDSRVTIDVNWTTGIGVVTLQSHWSSNDFLLGNDLDNTQYPLASVHNDYDETRVSQELRLTGAGERWDYLAGLYLSSTESDGLQRAFDGQPFFTFGPGTGAFLFARLAGFGNPVSNEHESYAGFGQVGYAISDDLHLDIGLRYERSNISGTVDRFVFLTNGAVIHAIRNVTRDASFNSVTGSVALTYNFTSDRMVYGSWSRGFKPGDFNTQNNIELLKTPYDPEQVDAYEFGMKADLADQRIRFNASLFYNDYIDLQVLSGRTLSDGTFSPFTSNAASSTAKGFETDIDWVAGENFLVGLGYAYMDARYDDYIQRVSAEQSQNLSGAPILRSPDHNGTLSATYTSDLGSAQLSVTAIASYTDGYANDLQGITLPDNTVRIDTFASDSRSLLSLSGRIEWRRWFVHAYVNNATDEEYAAAGVGVAPGFVYLPNWIAGEPRTYGITVGLQL